MRTKLDYRLIRQVITADQANRFARSATWRAGRSSKRSGDCERLDLSPAFELWQTLITEPLCELVKAQLGMPIKRHRAWMNIHCVEDDEEDWHLAAEGDLQFLCVLQAPAPVQGQLLFQEGPVTHLVPARAGDGVVFAPCRILHRTTCIDSVEVVRITASALFFG